MLSGRVSCGQTQRAEGREMEFMMSTETQKDETNDQAVEKARGAVEGLRDVMEAVAEDATEGKDERKEIVGAVTKWLRMLDKQGSTVADEARLQWHLGVLDVKERMQAMDESFGDFREEVRARAIKSSAPAKAKLDAARVQAHLAKMEGEDAAKERGADLRAIWEKEKDAVSRAADEVVKFVDGWTK